MGRDGRMISGPKGNAENHESQPGKIERGKNNGMTCVSPLGFHLSQKREECSEESTAGEGGSEASSASGRSSGGGSRTGGGARLAAGRVDIASCQLA